MELELIIQICLVIAIILVSLYWSGLIENMCMESFTDVKRPYLWVYWELKNGATKPPDYINLCLKTIKLNSHLFNYILLDNHTIYDYLPALRKDINDLPLALKADYIRLKLLYTYGGLWMDADTIMMTDMNQVVKLLNDSVNNDFVGFGCTGEICTNGYGLPSNWVMGARQHSILMGRCINSLDSKLNEYFALDKATRPEIGYHDLGKLIIWNNIKYLAETTGYKYFHFGADVDGTRDKKGNWVSPILIFKDRIDLLDDSKLMFVMLANSIYCGDDPAYNWFCTLSENDVLTGDYFVSGLFRKALAYNK